MSFCQLLYPACRIDMWLLSLRAGEVRAASVSLICAQSRRWGALLSAVVEIKPPEGKVWSGRCMLRESEDTWVLPFCLCLHWDICCSIQGEEREVTSCCLPQSVVILYPPLCDCLGIPTLSNPYCTIVMLNRPKIWNVVAFLYLQHSLPHSENVLVLPLVSSGYPGFPHHQNM